MMETDRKSLKIIFVWGMIVFALVVSSGCTQPFHATSSQVVPEETKNTTIPTPTVFPPDTSVTISAPDTTGEPTKTQTTTTAMTATGTQTITQVDTPVPALYSCNGDACGTLDIRLTCNPRILFRYVAILRIQNPNDDIERSAAVAAMGNNFADVLPDGSVIPVKIKPGEYTLILLDEKMVQVPESGIISSMGSVFMTTGKTTDIVFKEKC